jgi:hemoglobin
MANALHDREITEKPQSQKEYSMTTTLFERLGDAEGIARLVDDVIDAHLANPLIQTRYAQIKDMARIKQLSREFFTAGSGGPATYTGKGMLGAHKGMNISEQEFLAVMDDVVGAMNKNGIEEDAKKDVIAILYSLKGEIIRV